MGILIKLLLLLVTHLELLLLVVVVLLLLLLLSEVQWKQEFVTFKVRFHRVVIKHLIEINLGIYVVVVIITVDLEIVLSFKF